MGKNRDLIQKASRWRICQTSIPKSHLTQVRSQASFVLKGEEESVWLVVADFLAPEFCYCSCLCRSGYNVPIKLLFSVLQLFITP